jgi:perosamine synthetase
MDWRIKQVQPVFDHDEISAVCGTVERGWLTEGPCAEEFVAAIQQCTGSRYAVLAPNGTLGLFLGLLALDLPPGGEILIPSFTFYASASAAIFAGLHPVFVDVDPVTFNLDVDALDRHVTDRTVAVMSVHIYGHAAQADRIQDFAEARGLRVIEDAAQAYGVHYRGRHAGTWGDIGVISFFADKTVTTGEGGVVLTQDEVLYERLRLLRNQGRLSSGTFVHDDLGMNFRVTDLQCAVGTAQLRKLPAICEAKRRNHARYVTNLSEVAGIALMGVQSGSDHVPFRFAMRSDRREAVVAALEAAGVQTRTFFYPLHLQPALQKYASGALPVCEQLFSEGICLPVHGGLTPSDIDSITDIVRQVHRA